ncbi:SulP family inorganic anion transporter [Hwanghaeella sp.]|uniref:SulP family inorganic anion transporter n=1 Tax=Hwanghaeella sp. TaxID=2605943 RepID=UPI003CCBD596
MKPKILTTLETYSWSLFTADCLAGATVAMVAVPLSLAIAIASGAEPAQGLVTAIIGGFFISLLGGSRVQIGGPTGAFIVVVYGVIADHGYDGLLFATFMAGIILLVAGFLRIGNLIAYIPEAVINGFTIGIAIIIAKSQLSDLLGLQGGIDWSELGTVFQSVNAAAVGIGLGTGLVIILLRRAFPKFPGLIVAVALSSAIVAGAGLEVDTIVSRFGEMPNRLPLPSLPPISVERFTELLPSAFVIAFLAGVESLLSAMVADRAIGGSHRPNAEVIAQGAANVASTLFGGLPATGAIARTATNIRAGGKTPVAGIVHALVILAVMMLAAPLAGYLAMPAMAALLILTAWNMSEPHRWRGYMATPIADRMLLIVTLVLTVAADLTVAIGVGVALGLAIRLRRRKVQPAEWHTPDR